ncbi:PREDICTED: C-type lectin domain family 4 member M-like [Priapulus caudatus]|uniref:C-type lectin domain family 4 member M-like n=1 Tax=Priapulus caudatus TaxID=37621 RepID=A0ABM1EFF7_PRICU|nr:PREDICTED: C-type lectin domain family 4 member M-like [Priapulus caudatus]
MENTTSTSKQCELSAYADTDVGAAIVTDNYDFYMKVNTGQCPADFVEFRGNCYHIETTYRPQWQSARDRCINMGANINLVSLESPGEKDFLAPYFKTPWWTGGNDIAVDTQWVWNATGRQVDMCEPTVWGPSEPTNADNKYYVKIDKDSYAYSSGNWARNYVCEKFQE